MFRSPKALPGRSLAELGSLVPSKLPQGSLEPRHSAPKRELQQGFGPAGCAVLLQARFDRHLDCCPSGDLGGEEGCAADRALAMLEPAARRGAGGSGTFKGCQSLVEGIPGLGSFRVHAVIPHCKTFCFS